MDNMPMAEMMHDDMSMMDEDMHMMDRQPMTDEELATIIDAELRHATSGRGIGGDGSSDTHVARELEYYLGKLPGLSEVEAKDPAGSRIVSLDLMDAVEATVAEIMQMYSGDEIAYFEPENEQDEQQARQETEALNYLLLEEKNGYIVLQSAIKDALLHRNGVLNVYWDRRYEVHYDMYDQIPETSLYEVLQPQAQGEEVELISREEDGAIEEMVEQPSPGGSLIAEYGIRIPTYKVVIRRTRMVEGPEIKNVPPEQVSVAANHDSPCLEDARFCAYRKMETESSLIQQGFDPEVIRELPTYTGTTESSLLTSRFPGLEGDIYGTSEHESTRPIEVAKCYIRIDYDGDGIAELRHVLISGTKILENEPYDYVCLVSGTGTVMPHRYQGISLMDRLEDIQDGKTSLLRSIIDGGKLAAKGRTGAVKGQVNLNDLLMSRTGGVVRTLSQGAVYPIASPEVPPSVFNTMQFLDSIRRERGGAAVDTASQAQTVAGDTAHGIERVMSAIELYNSMVARTIGETLVRGLFLQLHRLLRKYSQGPVRARVGGRWTVTTPSQWPERTKVAIQLGSSRGERQQQAAVMTQVLALHEKLFAVQAPIVDMSVTYRAIVDSLKLGGIKSPEKYFIDPQSPQGQQAAQAQAQQQQLAKQQQDQINAMLAQAQAEIAQAEQTKSAAQIQANQYKLQIEQLKMQLASIKDRVDSSLQAQKISNEFALGVGKLEVEANRDMSRQVEQNRAIR